MLEILFVVAVVVFLLVWHAAKVPPTVERRARKAARRGAWDLLGWMSSHSG
jgi:hypothetical protein